MMIENGKRILKQEAEAVLHCAANLDGGFETAAEWILNCTGRVICCGVGKSGHIANKTAATLASTGSPAFFMHAAEAVHGDLGMVTKDDIMLVYTHSGETDELVRLFPSFKASGAKTILITGRPTSTAARLSDLVLDTGVREEACPNNLAPTTSTTVMIALSDALAISVMEARGFGKEDFARYHPAGALGKRLLLRVEDVMRSHDDIAIASPSNTVLEIMQKIANAGVGAACVVDDSEALIGFITEGDIRRQLLKQPIEIETQAQQFMNTTPSVIEPDLLAIEALEVFQNSPFKIGEMPVVKNRKVLGLLMLKDLLRSGIV
ncbi:MAG: KpsF/GutQ family sugar-phosphate isomerase [Armatimonadetes bacterium]|nr:KpsF/GutQ family sugar-phosphate isomerase [Armatimonadota bacterium]